MSGSLPAAARHPAVRLAGAALLTLAMIVGMVAVQRPDVNGAVIRAHAASEVVATLQTAGRPYSDGLRSALRASRADPADPDAAKAAARLLIDEGRTAGDSRLVGASIGVLRPFMDGSDAEVLTLAATARQYQHDFPGALALLDRAIGIAPHDTNALLIRSTIQVVQGKLATAQDDCRRITAEGRPDVGFLCQATALTLTPAAPEIYRRLAAITADPRVLDPGLRGWALGLMGEIADLRGDAAAARQHFGDTLALTPGDLRVRLMLADLMLGAGQDGDVLTLLARAPAVDGVLLRRYRAAERLGQTDFADSTRAELTRRVRLNLDLGLNAHAREDAQYFLLVAPDPALALERAAANWSLQHEIEDARILIAAAAAAGQPGAAGPVGVWMTGAGVSVPTVPPPPPDRVTAP